MLAKQVHVTSGHQAGTELSAGREREREEGKQERREALENPRGGEGGGGEVNLSRAVRKVHRKA